MADNLANHYLSFSLSDDLYALNVNQVREVLELVTITHVPRMPAFIKGIINLRGKVVPVVDLRTKFGLPAENTIHSRVVVVECQINHEDVMLGALVDSVSEVIELAEEDIQDAPSLGMDLNTEFIRGVGRHRNSEQFIILLDIDRVFSVGEVTILRDASAEPTGLATAGV